VAKKLDLRNKVFDQLEVMEFLFYKNNNAYWICRCSCGNFVKRRANLLVFNKYHSCGCVTKSKKQTHGLWDHKLYPFWNTMTQRCYNPNQKAYINYGGRGIQVCDEWKGASGLLNFIKDMENGYEKHLELDRIDVNGNYCKENCRWADYSMQGFNKRLPSNNKSGKTGVCWLESKSAWHAYIYKNNKKIDLGYFISLDDAIVARKGAELQYYGVTKE